MADTKISNLTDSGPLTGTEEIPGARPGVNIKITPDRIKTFITSFFDPAGSAASAETAAKNHSNAQDIVTLNAAKTYADSLATGMFRFQGTWNGAGNLYPTTGGSGVAGAIQVGDSFEISTPCNIQGELYDQGDWIIAKVNTPAQTVANWGTREHNTQQATESLRGNLRIVSQATIEDETSVDDDKAVTTKKFWLGIARMFTLFKDKSNGFPGLTLFSINFRNAANTFTSYFTNSNTAARTYTFQDRNGTIADHTDLAAKASLTGTETLTNKRITRRTGTIVSSATPTINTDLVDFFSITGQSVAISSMTTNLSGTPSENQMLWIAITDNGTARAIGWGPGFEGALLPITTVASTRLDVGFTWNTVTNKWRCVAVQ